MRDKAVIVRTEHYSDFNDVIDSEWYVVYRDQKHGPYNTYDEAEVKQKELNGG